MVVLLFFDLEVSQWHSGFFWIYWARLYQHEMSRDFHATCSLLSLVQRTAYGSSKHKVTDLLKSMFPEMEYKASLHLVNVVNLPFQRTQSKATQRCHCISLPISSAI